MRIKVADFNHSPKSDAVRELLACCGSQVWAEQMAACRPYADFQTLAEAAEHTWLSLPEEDWREAFASHPKIGDLKKGTDEQKGVHAASEEVLQGLAKGNRDYEARFGHIFLICATGKSAEEMLAALLGRMGNSAEKELEVAAGEQLKILLLRLEKLFHD